MISIKIKIESTEEAIELVKKAGKLDYDTNFTNGRCFVDAKSLLGVLCADFSRPCKLMIIADQTDEAIEDFISSIKDEIVELEVTKIEK